MSLKRYQSVLVSTLLVLMLVEVSGIHQVLAEPGNDQGCYCHNNGIAVWFNGTDSGLFPPVPVNGGASFVLNVTSKNIAATGVVPGIQQWMSNMTDTGKFTFNPKNVSATSSLNLMKKTTGAISAFYKITAPPNGGSYILTIFMQGFNSQITVQVTGPQASSSTTSSSSTSSSSSSSSSSFTSTSSASSTSSSTTSQNTESSTSTSKTSTTTASASGPDVLYYSSELAVIAVGFSLFVVAALWRYRKS